MPVEFVLLEHALEYVPSSYETVQEGSKSQWRKRIGNETTEHLHSTRKCVDAEPVCEALLPLAFIHVSIRPYARSLPLRPSCLGIKFSSKIMKQMEES